MSLFDKTVDSIKQSITDNYTGSLDTGDGSYFDTVISPVSFEIYRVYKSLEALQAMLFPTEESGTFIDDACAVYGLTRKAGTCAQAAVTLTGTAGAVIPEGSVFVTSDGLSYALDADVTLTDGTGEGTVTATEAGAEYNVAAGRICSPDTFISGLTSVSALSASGGADAESNAELLARYQDLLQNPSTGGNEADYRKWALSVNGVGNVCILKRWNGVNTVKVILQSSSGGAVSADIVSSVDTYIAENRPIGADVTVVSAAEHSIDISASVTLAAGYDTAAVNTAFSEALSEYLQELGIGGATLSYNKIAYLLLGTAGVDDYSALTVSGSSTSIVLAAGVAAVAGTVTITEAG